MTAIDLPKLKCKRCGWEWIPRGTVHICPRCKSKYWGSEKCVRVPTSQGEVK
jgi:hypothetical protein